MQTQDPPEADALRQVKTDCADPDSTGSDRGRILVIMPVYNEERFVGSAVIQARRYADAVIVVDDGSQDGTAEIAQTAGAIVVQHEHNMGKGAALNTGFRKATEFAPSAVVTMDADGQHYPDEMPAVIAPVLSGQADIVVGSRYLARHSQVKVPIHRMVGHWVLTHLTNVFSRVSTTDSQSGFRAFSPLALKCLYFRSQGFSVESEMQFLAREHALKVLEVPITVHYKDKPKRSAVVQGLVVLNGLLRFVGQYRPLLFLGGPGFLLILVGVGWGLWVVDIYIATHTLAIGYALICTLLVIVGTLSLFAGIILHTIRNMLRDFFEPGSDKY